MKKKLLFVLILLPFVALAQKTVIRVDTDRIIGEIDPNIYGGFQEGVVARPGGLFDLASPQANKDGWNSYVIDAMRELKITNLRWPGGNYMSSYDWRDGIGPIDQRPVRKDLARGTIDANRTGTDEWIALTRAIGMESDICFNMGLGTIDEARFWVEYCNLPEGTYYSDLRSKYGNPEPYNVKIWSIGNEIDGWDWINGYKNAEDYCKIGLETIKAIKNVDNSIKTIVVGASFYYVPPYDRWRSVNASWADYTYCVAGHRDWIDWNEKIIREFTGYADYLSVHRYWAENMSWLEHYEFLGDGQIDFEEKINIPRAQIEAMKAYHPGKKPLQISVDEWNARGNNMRGIMAIAMCLNSFVRNSDLVTKANITMMASLLNRDPERGYYKTPKFYTFKLFSINCLGNTVDTFVQGETFDTEVNKDIPYLDVTSVHNKERGSVFVNVVNRHADKAITADISNIAIPFVGKAQISSIEGALLEEFVYDKRDSYVPMTKETDVRNGVVTYTFPAHSITQIEIKLR